MSVDGDRRRSSDSVNAAVAERHRHSGSERAFGDDGCCQIFHTVLLHIFRLWNAINIQIVPSWWGRSRIVIFVELKSLRFCDSLRSDFLPGRPRWSCRIRDTSEMFPNVVISAWDSRRPSRICAFVKYFLLLRRHRGGITSGESAELRCR